MCISQSIIFYFKHVISIYIFMVCGPSDATQFHERTTKFPWMDHILSATESDAVLN
jgi:hypothetical protein